MFLVDLLVLTIRRLVSRPILTLLALLGVVLAVGLLSSTAFFSQAVDRVLLREELAKLSKQTGRHPFATRVYVFPTARRPMKLAQAETVGKDIAGALSGEIGLPIAHLGTDVESVGLMLLPTEGDFRYGNDQKLLNQISLQYIADVADHLTIVAGDPFPAENDGAADNPQATVLDVWMHNRLAQEMGVRPGETFRVTVNLSQFPVPVRVRGLWQAKDPHESFWFSNPDQAMKNTFLIQRSGYIQFAEPMMAAGSGSVSWPIMLDDSAMNPAHARQYAQGYQRGMTIINQFLPGAKLDVSALDPLEKFVQRQSTLTTMLISFNLPALGFLLAFLMLIAMIVADWQRRETAILVSRGMGTPSVLALTALEEAILYLVGVPLGILFGMWLARMMGYTSSFLTFISRDPLPVSMQGLDYRYVAAALAVALLARLLPALQASKQSVVTEERTRIRPLRAPWFQRVFLDILLLLPTWYAYQQLTLRGSLGALTGDRPEDILQDPLLVLLPALMIFCAALLSMRFFFIIMRIFDWLARWVRWLPLHLSLRQISRAGQYAVTPLLLIIVVLGLGIYTATLAASLDQWLLDRVHYSVGTDVSFLPMPPGSDSGDSGSSSGTDAADSSWVPTKAEFSDLDGVISAGRVGRYPARIPSESDREIRGHFLGVDRADFSRVAWFRNDFADQPLGALMNLLAFDDANVLVPERYLELTKFHVGDKIKLTINYDEITVTEDFKIAGTYQYFPTVYDDDLTVIGNLDYLFLLTGIDLPYDVWMQTNGKLVSSLDPLGNTNNTTGVFRQVKDEMGIIPGQARDARLLIEQERGKFERVGVFGTLSVGFLAATLMAILALLIYSYASLQERLYQFGVLRAIGIRKRQALMQVALEYSILTLFGALAGWLIGVQTAQLFAPFFRITGRPEIALPPLIPIIPQEQIVTLVVAFVVFMVTVQAIVIAFALAGRLFSVLRMGHVG
ncbi:MAG: ABC transporter permease [Caldilineaceae bacterium]